MNSEYPLTIVIGARNWPLLTSIARDLPYHCKVILYEPDQSEYETFLNTADFSEVPARALGGVLAGPVENLRAAAAGIAPDAIRILPEDEAAPIHAALARFYLEDARAFYAEAQSLLDACSGGINIEGTELCERMIAHIAAAHADGRGVSAAHRTLLVAIDMLTRVTREEMDYD